MLVRICVVFAIVFISSSYCLSSCGYPGKSSSFIVNGTDSRRGAWPWIAAIHKIEGDRFICGGTLITSNVVISAAHCFQEKNKFYESAITHPTKIVIKLGKHDLTELNERGSESKYPIEIIIHPDWKPQETRYDGDIAVIILESRVQISNTIIPICFWSNSHPPTAEKGTVVGWGKAKPGTLHEIKPKELEVFIRLNVDCFLNDHRFAVLSSKSTFCAGKDAHSGPCRGDSGSGMFVQSGSDRTLRWYLRGIVSAGFVNDGECDTSVDVIFTDLMSYTQWIQEILDSKEIKLPIPPQKPLAARPTTEIFCFFESWSESRKDEGTFHLNDLKPELCTTLVFLHAMLENDNLASIFPNQQLDEGNGLYRKFTKLKKKHPHLKTLLAIGSWNEGSEKYSELAADADRRKRFASRSAEFLEGYGFDGLHFHWEHPAHRGGIKEDKQNFVKLLRDIKEVYSLRNLYLSVFVRTQQGVVEKGYDLPEIGKVADAVLMMTFDYGASWNWKVGYPAPIKGEGDLTLDSRVDYFTRLGVPAEKLIIGVPFFGRSFTTKGKGDIGEVTINGNGFPGPFFNQDGFLGYNEICFMRKNQEWIDTFDEEASQAIARFDYEGNTNVVIYDSPRSVANKVKFMKERDLGGVWTWFVDSDDFRGDCKDDDNTFADFPQAMKKPKREAKDFPLLRTINEAIEMLSTKKTSIDTSWVFPDQHAFLLGNQRQKN